MAYYTINGPGHRAMRRLSEGPATTLELKQFMRPVGSCRQRNKGWRVIDQLRRDDCLRGRMGFWVITRLGADALACLDGGHPFVSGKPSIRVFRPGAPTALEGRP